MISAESDLTRTPGTAPDFEILPAEEVLSYEIGGAAKLLGGALDLNGSVFYYEYSDFQTSVFEGGRLVTVNAGDASAYGFEGQADWRINGFVRLFGNYGYNHSRFDSGAREGNSFRLSPDHELAVGGFFAYPIGGAGELFFSPTYTWRSEVFFDDDNDRSDLQTERFAPGVTILDDFAVDEVQDAYGLLNARLGFEHASGGWSIEGFAKNALDEEYLIDAGNSGDLFGLPTFIRGPGRLLGVEIKARR